MGTCVSVKHVAPSFFTPRHAAVDDGPRTQSTMRCISPIPQNPSSPCRAIPSGGPSAAVVTMAHHLSNSRESHSGTMRGDDFELASDMDTSRNIHRSDPECASNSSAHSRSSGESEFVTLASVVPSMTASPLKGPPRCPDCKEVQASMGARFCSYCGTKLDSTLRKASSVEFRRFSTGSFSLSADDTGQLQLDGVKRWRVRIQYDIVLGRGATGTVYGCIETTTGKPLACKQVSFAADNEMQLTEVRNEITHLSRVRHRNIIEYYGVSVKNRPYQTTVSILMERLSCGTLLAALTAFPGGMPESVVQQYMYQLLCAVDYIHSMSITHRDIKPGNVLLTNEGVVKLTDFGTAMAGSNFDHVAGTPGYMPPEALTGSKDKANAFERAKAHDIWSLGCTAYHLLTGRAPWAHTNLQDFPLAAYIHRAQCFEYEVALPEGPIKHLIERCLVPAWEQRPSAGSIIQGLILDE